MAMHGKGRICKAKLLEGIGTHLSFGLLVHAAESDIDP